MGNSAVFGIYKDRGATEAAIDRLRANGFRATDISVLLPENSATKISASGALRKRPKGRRRGRIRSGRRRRAGLARRHRQSSHSRHRATDRGGADCRRHWRAPGPAGLQARSSGRSPVLAFPNTRQNATRAGSEMAVSYSRSTPTTRTGKIRRNVSSTRQAQRMLARPRKSQPTMMSQIGRKFGADRLPGRA